MTSFFLRHRARGQCQSPEASRVGIKKREPVSDFLCQRNRCGRRSATAGSAPKREIVGDVIDDTVYAPLKEFPDKRMKRQQIKRLLYCPDIGPQLVLLFIQSITRGQNDTYRWINCLNPAN
jgi:hypothetical protein